MRWVPLYFSIHSSVEIELKATFTHNKLKEREHGMGLCHVYMVFTNSLTLIKFCRANQTGGKWGVSEWARNKSDSGLYHLSAQIHPSRVWLCFLSPPEVIKSFYSIRSPSPSHFLRSHLSLSHWDKKLVNFGKCWLSV